MVISFDGVNKDAIDYVKKDKIASIVECNPYHGPRVEAIVRMLEAGETPEKFTYVDEEIFSADETVLSLTVDGRNYMVTILSGEN